MSLARNAQLRGRQRRRALLLLGVPTTIGAGAAIALFAPPLWLAGIGWLAAVGLLLASFYVARKRVRGASLLWIVMMLGVSVSFRRRDPGLLMTSEALDSQVLAELAISIACGLYVSFRAAPRLKRVVSTLASSPLKWILVYAFAALLSTAYSSSPALTLVTSMQLLVALGLLGTAISAEGVTPERLFDATLVGLLVIEAAVWALYFWARELAITVQWPNLRRLGGLLIHPNSLGVVAAVLGVVALRRGLGAKRALQRLLYLMAFIIAVVTLICTQGRAAFVAFVLASMLVLMLLRRRFLLWLGVLLILTVALLLPQAATLGADLFKRGEDITQLTGRVSVWWHIVRLALRSAGTLLLGYGFSSSRVALLAQLPGGWTHAHNAFMEALMGLGLLGLILVAMSFLSAGLVFVRGILRRPHERYGRYVEWCGVLVVLLVVSMASATIGGRLNISGFIYLSMLAGCVRPRGIQYA
jgi:O-antigen ligase